MKMEKKFKRVKNLLKQYEHIKKNSSSEYIEGMVDALKFAVEVLEEIEKEREE